MARYKVHLAGESFANPDGSSRQKELAKLQPGDDLFLTREPNNPHDPNAIRVESERVVGIGYIEGGAAAVMAKDLDAGEESAAVLVSVGRGKSGLLGAIVEVRTGASIGGGPERLAYTAPDETAPARKPFPGEQVDEHGQKPKSKTAMWIVIGLFVFWLLSRCAPDAPEESAAEPVAGAGVVSSEAATEAPAPEPEPVAKAVSARALFDAFQANEVAAKAEYGVGPIAVSGTVAGVTLDLFDKPVVQLATSNQFMPVQASGLDAATAGAMSKGQNVTVVCARVGEVIGAPMLDDCTIQK